MLDAEDEAVIVDMTAGADAFSSSLFAKVDVMVLVVEPTLKSLSVYDQFAERVEQHNLKLLVVGNKVQDEADKVFIEERVDTLAAVIGQSSLVRARERGEEDLKLDSDKDLVGQLSKLSAAISEIPRDWKKLEERSHELHSKNAEDWMGADAAAQIDPDFSLQDHASSLGF